MNVISLVALLTSMPTGKGHSGIGIRGARYTLFSGLPCSSRNILSESAEAMISNEPVQWAGEAFIDSYWKAASLKKSPGGQTLRLWLAPAQGNTQGVVLFTQPQRPLMPRSERGRCPCNRLSTEKMFSQEPRTSSGKRVSQVGWPYWAGRFGRPRDVTKLSQRFHQGQLSVGVGVQSLAGRSSA